MLQVAVRVEDLICLVPHIRDNHAAITHDHHGLRTLELARSVADPPEASKVAAVHANHDDTRGLPVQYVEIASFVEADLVDLAKLLPLLARQRSHPVDLFEVGLEPAVLGRELDDLLGREADTPSQMHKRHGTGRRCDRARTNHQFTPTGNLRTITTLTPNSSSARNAARPPGPNASGILVVPAA